jgi:hypothetical protein
MSIARELYGLLRNRFLQLLALISLFFAAGWQEISSKAFMGDTDIWWHLSVGNWILQHHAFPRAGILSRTAANRPWIDYSWGFEVLLAKAYSWFGLVGVDLFPLILLLGIIYSIFWLLRCLSGRFWASWLMTLVAFYAIYQGTHPRPVLFTILFFTIELGLLLQAHRSGDPKLLYWLPALFVLWSNVHMQFLYGLFLIALFAAVVAGQHLASRFHLTPDSLLQPVLPSGPLLLITAGCFLATLISPYSYRLYQVAFGYLHSGLFHSFLGELAPPDFRSNAHYVQLLLTAGGFFVVGWQKKLDPFKLAMLLVCSMVGFRMERDGWFICIPAMACIAEFAAPRAEPREPETFAAQNALLVAILSVVLFILARNSDYSDAGLLQATSRYLPVRAVAFVQQNHLPSPLYNTQNFGGFLMWAMPEYPVAIDGRIELYGDDIGARYSQVLQGAPFYAQDPEINSAGVLITERAYPVSWRLEADPNFQLVYQDELADVFIPIAR